MNREEKIQLLKKVQSGDLNELIKFKKEAHLEKVQDEYFVPCFFFLLENRSFDQDVYNVVWRKNNDEFISIFREGCNQFEKDNNYSRVSFECLVVFKNLLSTLYDLNNTEKLKILDPFKKRKLKTLPV